MLLLKKGSFLWILAVFFLSACTKEMSCEDCNSENGNGANKPPVAHAGSNQKLSLTATSFELNGTQSTDPNNNIASYLWTKISGPSDVLITNSNAVQTSVSGIIEGVYLFELKVADTKGLFSKDTVEITIGNPPIEVDWQKLQSVPEHEFFFGTNYINFLVGIQGKLYAVSKIRGLWLYEPQENKWKKLGDLPTQQASTNFSVVFSINNVGYFVGNGTSRQYNATTNKWTTKNNVPVDADHVDYSVPLIIDNKAYLVGSTNNLVTLFDPSTDTYTAKNKFPDVGAEAGFVINNIGYCVQQDGRLWQYDVASDSWQQKTSVPAAVSYMSGFTLNGYGYIIGDVNGAANSGAGRMKLWRYHSSLDKWEQLDDDYPGEAVNAIRTVSLNGLVYIGLGYTTGDLDAIDVWSLK